MSKRPIDGRAGGPAAKRCRRHLYLVMDDWEFGYSIHEVDLSPHSDSDVDDVEQQLTAVSDDNAIDTAEQPFPPAVIRLESPHSRCDFVAACRSKIIITYPVERMGIVPVFDVHMRSLNFSGPQRVALPSFPIYLPVGDKLIALDVGCSEMLYPPPPEDTDLSEWHPWCKLPKPPFSPMLVTSYAVHPDGRTVFVSVKRGDYSKKKSVKSGASATTFTIYTGETECYEWKRHGHWMLPFTGQAHFDGELDAWVGLSHDPDTLGYLCSCNVLSTGADAQPPTWKLSKESLFCKNPPENHVSATLVYLGGRSKFCLVQCLSIDECWRDESYYKKLEEEDLPRPCRHLLRLKTFSLKYDKNGDLCISHHQVRSYKWPTRSHNYLNSFLEPVAFWM